MPGTGTPAGERVGTLSKYVARLRYCDRANALRTKVQAKPDVLPLFVAQSTHLDLCSTSCCAQVALRSLACPPRRAGRPLGLAGFVRPVVKSVIDLYIGLRSPTLGCLRVAIKRAMLRRHISSESYHRHGRAQSGQDQKSVESQAALKAHLFPLALLRSETADLRTLIS